MARRSTKPHPPVGLVCEHRYKGTLHTMVVVETADGKVGYQVDGVIHASPTAAAKAVVGKDQFINGRTFWHLE